MCLRMCSGAPCTRSVNEVICHGIPDCRELQDGDICNGMCVTSPSWPPDTVLSLSVDITVYVGGFHGDLNETFFVGNVDEGGKKLVRTAYECLMKGIEIGTYCVVGRGCDPLLQ